ncbi:FadD32-like long-chain-fatty-acid--AMP ligase [Corynebacterium pelargi]|uniref:Long-chain-fatty-acid--AMP ligase FadD32 n=1 Tax=Corynebacterium pelargi TaxID=1471400 RepID=A0A410W6B8_9CORY|nr:FadD32-like long-chain-fatty-acid--AMP ligase [Corynebacterium pelargi]QAU51490.1 Long-chain-fatty-acid--AMP ligase FadD32 [Corynebacterium pelargi]GGG79520.1 acyl-CoA synthetase [Corynebacterium pelargi]
MDIQAAMGRFFDEQGNIALTPELTLAALSEIVYQMDLAAGQGERHCMRFWDYSQSREGEAKDYNRTQINTRVKVIAARLQQTAQPGARVAILANNSPEYIFSFLGILYAGMTPVPLYDPTEPGHAHHLEAVIGDARPEIVLTNSTSASATRRFFASTPGSERPRILSVDALPDSLAAQWQQPQPATNTDPVDTPALLQYTSGSTRTPAGVILTHRSVITNVLQIFRSAQVMTPLRMVTWLPLHHDMGIIVAALVNVLGLQFEFMSPRDFIQQPERWLKQLSEGEGNVYTAIPNFALEMSARVDAPEGLDLSKVVGLIVGSEPVTEKAVQNFLDKFEPFGLQRQALRPSYGLAEAALLVSTPQTEQRPVIRHFDREALANNEAKLSEGGVPMVGCGQVVNAQHLVIVDPDTKAELPEGKIGELWAHGQNMAAGYLGREAETQATFRNTLGERITEGLPEDDFWMASGDLAMIVDGELFITGRLKDLIIVAGRNHYPQDVEYTVDHASEQVRPYAVAAFAIEGDDVEKLIILAERDPERGEEGDAEAIEAIRAAVTQNHGVQPADIRIMDPDTIARSSSGKIARRVAKQRYLSS